MTPREGCYQAPGREATSLPPKTTGRHATVRKSSRGMPGLLRVMFRLSGGYQRG